MLINMSFSENVAYNTRQGATTFAGVYGADRLPRRYVHGLFECNYANPHLLLPSGWEEFPDFSQVDKYRTSFGIYDNVDQFYTSGYLNKMEYAPNHQRYCCLGVKVTGFSAYTNELVPADFGPYYGSQGVTREELRMPAKYNEQYQYFFFSIFRYTGM